MIEQTQIGDDDFERPDAHLMLGTVLLGLLVLASAVLLPVLQGMNGSGSLTTGEGDATRQVVYVILFAGALGLSTTGEGLSHIRLPVGLLLLVAWSWLSLVWAIDPAIAFRRLALTTMIFVSLYLLVATIGADRSLRALGVALLLTLAINYCWIAVGMGTHQVGEIEADLAGNWRGATIHKNVAGALSAFTILSLLFYPVLRGLPRLLCLVLAAVFLFYSQSKTAMALTLLAALAGMVYASLGDRLRGLLVPLGFIAVVCAAAIGQEYLLYQLDQLLLPGALTGRGQIWPILLRYAGENLWFGSGYGSFWNLGNLSPVSQLTGGWVARITTGHNGYLDLLVQIGLPGLLLALFATVLLPLWTLTTQKDIPVRMGATLTALLVFAIGQNMTESSLFDRDIAVWVVMAITLAAIQQFSVPRSREEETEWH